MTDLKANAYRDHSRGVASHQRRRRWFLRHLVEMVLAMFIGMFVAVGIFAFIVGGSYDEARQERPTAALLVMAIGMTAPMVAWMWVRRHTWRASTEMGAAMMLPALPLLVLLWCHVTRVALTGPYMALSTTAMVALMVYRRDEYSSHPATRLRPRSR